MSRFYFTIFISLVNALLAAALPTSQKTDVLNTDDYFMNHDFYSENFPKCSLTLLNNKTIKHVANLLKVEKVVIIEYLLDFVNYTSSPLKFDDSFNPEIWFRTSSEHGQILLNLAFNYGILSMKTLTLGTANLKIDIIDSPANCMVNSTSSEQLYSIQYLLLRDFNFRNKVTLGWKESVCRKVVINQSSHSSFVHECVSLDSETLKLVVTYRLDNSWIHILKMLLMAVRVVGLAFIPCVLVSMTKGLIKQRVPYVVRLPENSSIQKTIIIVDDIAKADEYKSLNNFIDLSKETGYPKLKNILLHCNYSVNTPCSVKFQQYDILVDYHRTQPEDNIKVGFMQTLTGLAFRCKLKEIGPFVICCQSKMVKYVAENKCFLLWITFWQKFASILLVIVIPLPYYLRIVIYYLYEHDEIENRKAITSKLGLQESFENCFIHYLTPTHPLFIFIYVIYFITGFVVALAPYKHDDRYPNHVLKRIVNSFRDLDEFSFNRVVSYLFANFTYPFYKHGICGCLVCIFYWAMAFPLIIFVCLVYSVPTLYISVRMIHYCKHAIYMRLSKRQKPLLIYQVSRRKSQKKFLDKLKIENIHLNFTGNQSEQLTVNDNLAEKTLHNPKSTSQKRADCWHCITYSITTLLCVLTFWGMTFVLAELVVFVIQVIVFTIMGVIVNAGYILRHVLVVAIIVMYCFDSFINMEKRYLKMNKMIFQEVTKRIKDLDSVTCLPSFLQENRGFKSEELSEQAFYENTDAMVPIRHWMINDLVMFMDSEDMPRIPRKLFKEVCNIRVPGVPGPIYRGQLDALKQLAKVVFFVFLVVIAVMIFAEVYSLSSTNQLIATVAGSFLPLMFRSWMFQQSADVEVNTVTFKCHFDELVKSFHQNWPIYDLTFRFDADQSLVENDPEIIIYMPKSLVDTEN